ncbi:MAG: hypothetical protein U9R07_09625 [Pseudomonadota bacterium]|nr:hypothetical protein [Pseudomonadota bacterium]
MRIYGLSALALLSACSDVSVAESGTDSGEAQSIINTESGRYRVELDTKIEAKALPANADLKMLDGDLTQYAVKLCGLDFANKLRPDRCEVFVQPDKSGLLTGYVALQQGGDVQIVTELETDRQRTGIGCFLSGAIENTNLENPTARFDVSQDFEARLPFFGWEKSPGDWMISSESSDENSSGGMWYIKRLKSNLRVTQERWNYCYRDSKVYIDEVFIHAATLVRSAT